MARAARAIRIHPEHIGNVAGVVLQATPAEHEAGMEWYTVWGQRIAEHGKAHGLTEAQAVAIFATLSPQMRPLRNWKLYTMVVEQGVASAPITREQKRKCAGILASPDGVDAFISGPKVTAFYRNLIGQVDPVTVDRHCASCVYGIMIDQVGPGQFTYCTQVVTAAAGILGLSPMHTQSIAWVVWRRMKGLVGN